MDYLNKKYPILSQKNILGSSQVGINAPIVVFLMDRIMISDNKITREESDTLDELAEKYGELFGFGSFTFQAELMRIGQIYENYISLSEDARMVSEAIDFVSNEFSQKQKLAIIHILEELAISDSVLNNKELAILFSIVEAFTEERDEIIKNFARIYERIIKVKSTEHQMAKALIYLMNLIQEDPKSVKLSVLGRPDPTIEGAIPPILLTDEEFADWVILFSFLRGAKYKNALMHQTRIYWNLGKTTDGKIMQAQKGLIRLFKPENSKDNQFEEAISFTKKWVQVLRKGTGNVNMVDETIFQIIIFGDEEGPSFLPDFTKKDIWKITCKKISSGYEVHAFDFPDDKNTYWCPETYKELSKKILSEECWVNGEFPTESSLREKFIKCEIVKYDS